MNLRFSRESLRWVLLLGACVGATAAHAAPATEWARYVVRPGDNLWRLTARHLNCTCHTAPLMALNQVTDPLRLRPGSVLKIPTQWLRQEAAWAEVAHASGTVLWAPHEQAPLQTLRAGDKLGPQAIVQTAANGQCTLTLNDHSAIVVRPESRVRLTEVRRSTLDNGLSLRLKVEQGGVENHVQPRRPGGRFHIETPIAVATVRGTDFSVNTNGTAMRTEVLHGRVQVNNPRGQRVLAPGTGSLVSSGQAPGAAQPLPGAPDLSHVPRQIGRFPLELAWPGMAGVQGYRTQWKVGGNELAVLTEPTTERLTLLGRDVPDGTHVLRVRAVDTRGFEGLPAEVTVQVHRLPDPPIYLQPQRDAVLSDARPIMAWATGNAPAVRLQISRNAEFSQPHIDTTFSNDGRAVVPNALEPGLWHWRMASVSPHGDIGPWGPIQQLTRQPDAPKLQPPDQEGEQMVLRWQPVAGASSYEVELRQPASTTPPIVLTAPDAALPLPRELPSGPHEVRVRTVLASGVGSDWSAPQQFTVPKRWSTWPLGLLLLLPLLP